MLWLYLTGLALLIGAEINAEIEHAAAERWRRHRQGSRRTGGAGGQGRSRG
jgi:uncharacterized BrkB/YihY/UPF0761 family membrane protein